MSNLHVIKNKTITADMTEEEGGIPDRHFSERVYDSCTFYITKVRIPPHVSFVNCSFRGQELDLEISGNNFCFINCTYPKTSRVVFLHVNVCDVLVTASYAFRGVKVLTITGADEEERKWSAKITGGVVQSWDCTPSPCGNYNRYNMRKHKVDYFAEHVLPVIYGHPIDYFLQNELGGLIVVVCVSKRHEPKDWREWDVSVKGEKL